MAVTLWTANEVPLQLILKIVSTAKPAFELVIVVTAEVVNDHEFILGAGTGVEKTLQSIVAQSIRLF